jgi:hypothetical protein
MHYPYKYAYDNKDYDLPSICPGITGIYKDSAQGSSRLAIGGGRSPIEDLHSSVLLVPSARKGLFSASGRLVR